MKIGIFGGTFNPVHYGHLRAAEEVREKFSLDKILFIPAKDPPLKMKDLADAGHRFEMLRLSLKGNKWFELSDVEFGYKGKSYTVKTIEILNKKYPEDEIYLILGIDSFIDLPNWWKPEKLINLIDFIVISRPNFSFSDLNKSPYIRINPKLLKMMDNCKKDMYISKMYNGKKLILLKITGISISSTMIRDNIKCGSSIKYLLPQEVYSYIIKNKLYKN